MSSHDARRPGVFGIGAAVPSEGALPPDGSLAALVAEAAAAALADAGRDGDEVDRVIVCTITADDVTPGLAPGVVLAIGADNAGAIDVSAGGAGFLYGLDQAAALIESGRAEVVLVCAADAMSRLRGVVGDARDAAAAAVVSHGDLDVGCPRFVLGADGAYRAAMFAPIDTRELTVDRDVVERVARGRIGAAMNEALLDAGVRAGGSISSSMPPASCRARLSRSRCGRRSATAGSCPG